jgi:hypothetical protein
MPRLALADREAEAMVAVPGESTARDAALAAWPTRGAA